MGRADETLKVTTFDLPKGMANDEFTVEVTGPKQYQLTSSGGFSARGKVGKPLSKDGVKMVVSEIHAQEGSEFTVTKYSTLGMINQLQNNLTVTETGKDTGVLSLTYMAKIAIRSAIFLTASPATTLSRISSVNRKKRPKAWRSSRNSFRKCARIWTSLRTSSTRIASSRIR
ncbi:Tyrosine-protein kinase wzc [Cronobacter sakazakii]|nr:Tyrosine-protein kinase wzc [Cronobacter sakazakii]